MAIIGIWINCPDAAVADAIAEHLVERRLAASANLYPPVRSVYRWKGAVERRSETPLLVKTRADLFNTVEVAVRELHPHETPSVTGVDIAHVDAGYRDWVFTETGDTGE